MIGDMENVRTENDAPGIKRDVLQLKNQDKALQESVLVIIIEFGNAAKK